MLHKYIYLLAALFGSAAHILTSTKDCVALDSITFIQLIN